MKQAFPFLITIGQQKGGVGKTAPALCMGAELAQQAYQQVLRQNFTKVHFSKYQFIILDCPPGVGPLIKHAMAAASLVIVPLECGIFSLQTLKNMVQLIKDIRALENPMLVSKLPITKTAPRDIYSEQNCHNIKRHYHGALFETINSLDHNIPKSQLAGISLAICPPKAHASQQYQPLTKEKLSLIDQNKSLFREIEVN